MQVNRVLSKRKEKKCSTKITYINKNDTTLLITRLLITYNVFDELEKISFSVQINIHNCVCVRAHVCVTSKVSEVLSFCFMEFLNTFVIQTK